MNAKNPKSLPFRFFGTTKTVQRSHFLSDVRFSQYIFNKNFSHNSRKFDVISKVKRYIRILNAISKIYWVLLRRRRRSKKCVPIWLRHAISELLNVFRIRKAPFGWFETFCGVSRRNVRGYEGKERIAWNCKLWQLMYEWRFFLFWHFTSIWQLQVVYQHFHEWHFYNFLTLCHNSIFK